jgi:hypothetical protein
VSAQLAAQHEQALAAAQRVSAAEASSTLAKALADQAGSLRAEADAEHKAKLGDALQKAGIVHKAELAKASDSLKGAAAADKAFALADGVRREQPWPLCLSKHFGLFCVVHGYVVCWLT